MRYGPDVRPGKGGKAKKRKSRARTMSQPESEGNLVVSYRYAPRTEVKMKLLESVDEVEVLLVRPRESCLEVLEEGLEWLEESKDGNVFGFDLEWKPDYGKRKSKSPIALLQLATKTRCLLVHTPSGWDGQVKAVMRDWLSLPGYLKIGIGMSQDRVKLQETLGYDMPSTDQLTGTQLDSTWIDLSLHHVFSQKNYSASTGFDSLFRLFDAESESQSRRVVKEAKSASQKRRATMSKWDASALTSTQVSYAVFDAWGAREIFLSMSTSFVAFNECECTVCKHYSDYNCSLRGIKETLTCNRCSFTTFTAADMDSHLSRRCQVAPEPVPIEIPLCVTCHQGFRSVADLEWHQKSKKHGKYRLECNSCGEVFKTNKFKTKTAQKKAHVCESLGCVGAEAALGSTKAHIEHDSTALPCNQCHKIFNDKLALQLHLLWHSSQHIPEDLLTFTEQHLGSTATLANGCLAESCLGLRV